MQKSKLRKSIILLSITLCGCLPATINNLSIGKNTFNDTKENPYKLWKEDLKRKHQNKIPFTDSVNIKLKSQKENKTFSVLSTKTTLYLNTIPISKIVYRKEFLLNKKELDIKENIIINDTSKRYLLYIKKEPVKNEVEKINININTFDWVKNYELENNDTEIIKESLLLNNNNSLQIHLEGKESSKVTIALIEDDNSGTILKRNTLGNHKTNQDHINANDINIFDINDTTKFPFLSEEDKDIRIKTNEFIRKVA